MLEVHSPVPMTEGESLSIGQVSVTTKQLTHFFAGVLALAPVAGLVYVVAPALDMPRFLAALLAAGAGFVFAAVPYRDRSLAEVLWLTVRYARRPQVVLYDRAQRTARRRKGEGECS